jgi:hypothetical protein
VKRFLKILILATVFFSSPAFYAQDDEPQTIKVRKEQELSKAYFDNTEMKLTVIDRFGNTRENKIISYKLWIKEPKHTRHFVGLDNNMSVEMINELNKQKKSTKIFFTEIKAKDDEGHLVDLPDVIEYWFPNCKNCEPVKKKK